jgi:RNA polymerase sigma-54 factor
MELGISPQLAPLQTLGVSAELVARAEMLALSSAELADEVRRELDANPALVLEESPAPIRAAPVAATAVRDLEPTARESDADRLLTELRLACSASEHPIAEHLVASLDDRGYLDAEPGEIAATLGVEPARVDRVLAELRSLGPPGIAARDLSQCLTLQLDRQGVADPVVREVIGSYLPSLAAGRYAEIAAALGVSRHDVLRARTYIRTRLRPSPAFSNDPAPAMAALVDVRLTEPARFPLRVCPLYAELARDGTPRERRHAEPRARRASEFTSRIVRRWDTMASVAEFAVQSQAEFVRRGSGPRSSLTRAEVARALSVHESTVSRAVRDRHARLPGGSVIPLSELFGVADGAREALRALLLSERRPRTDTQLAEALAVRGHRVARRTVAKYRAQLGALQHALR